MARRICMRKICLLSFTWGLLFWGCSLSDEDRCPSGYEYKPDDQFCYKIVDGGDGDSGPVSEENFGQECQTDGDCSGGNALYCAIPFNEDTGECVYTDCHGGDPECPAGYFCADCRQSSIQELQMTMCLEDSWKEAGFIQTQCDWEGE